MRTSPDQGQLLVLLAEGIEVELSDEDQLWPEQSTSAIVLHHPQARYFNVERWRAAPSSRRPSAALLEPRCHRAADGTFPP